MSTVKKRQFHVAPGKIEIEDRSYHELQQKETDGDVVGQASSDKDMQDTGTFHIDKDLSPSKTSGDQREGHMPHSKTSISEESSDIAELTAEVTKLKASLEKMEAEKKLIEKEKDTLEAESKKIQSDKNKLEAYAKRKLANYQDHHMRTMQEGDDKLKQEQAKIDATKAQNSELKRKLAEKVAENKLIAKEKDALEAEYKKIRREKKELEVFAKKKLDSTKDKHFKVLQGRNHQLDAAYAEISKLKSLLTQKETENKQITDENDVLEAKYKKSKSDKKELEAYAKKKLATTKHKYQKVLQERNIMLKQKQDKIDSLNRRNRR